MPRTLIGWNRNHWPPSPVDGIIPLCMQFHHCHSVILSHNCMYLSILSSPRLGPTSIAQVLPRRACRNEHEALIQEATTSYMVGTTSCTLLPWSHLSSQNRNVSPLPMIACVAAWKIPFASEVTLISNSAHGLCLSVRLSHSHLAWERRNLVQGC